MDKVLSKFSNDTVFTIVTKNQDVTIDAVKSFVNDAREKGLQDFNIAKLIKAGGKTLVRYLI